MLSKACRGSNGITFRTADSRRRMRRQGPHPKPGFPQSGKSDKPWAFASSPNRAQTAPLTRPPSDEHLAPLAFRQFCPTPRADLMPPTVSPTGHLRLTPCSDPITPGHGSTSGNRWSPDTPRASAILANKPPRAHGPLRSLSAMVALPETDGARTHLGHLPSSPADDLRAHCLLRPLSAMAALPATDGARTHFGRTGPHWSTIDGSQPTAAPAAIAAAPGKFNAPSPTRRTSPVMTNDRVSPLSPLP